jgi:hypothetical protein
MKNMNDMRAMLCEEIQNIRDGKQTASNLNAIVNATGKILSTIKMEIEVAKITNKQPKISFIELEETVKLTALPAPEKKKAA